MSPAPPLRRATFAVALALAGAVLSAGAATAASLDSLARDLAERGYAVEPGADVDEAAVADVVAGARAGGERLSVAVLATEPDTPTADAEPETGAMVAAEALRQEVGDGTVLVVTPGAIGYASTVHDDARLDAAADQAVAGFDAGGTAQGVAAFAEALSSRADPARGPAEGSGRIGIRRCSSWGCSASAAWRCCRARGRAGGSGSAA